MKNWMRPDPLPPEYSLLECNSQNFHAFDQFWKENEASFKIHIFSKYSNLLDLIKTGNIFIYLILNGHDAIAAYFFRKTCIFVDKNQEALTCFASINGTTSNEFFIQGFRNALYKIVEKNKNFECCAIESISNNDVIVQNLLSQIKPFVISPTAYFFYNFAYPTFPSNKVIVVC